MLNCDSRRIFLIVILHVLLAAVYLASSYSSYWSSEDTITSPSLPSYSPSSSDRKNQQEIVKKTSENENQQEQQQQSSSSSSAFSMNGNHHNTNNNNNKYSIPKTSGGVLWPELGNAGWKKPTRQRHESSFSCPQARENLEQQYQLVKSKVNFNSGPRFGMPWFFHEPYPVCGSVLLRHLHGSLDTVPVLRISSSSSSSSSASSIDQKSQDQQNDRNHHHQKQFKETFGEIDTDQEVLNVIAGDEVSSSSPSKRSVFIEECGDGNDFTDTLITARLVSQNFMIAAHVSSHHHHRHHNNGKRRTTQGGVKNNDGRRRRREISFVAPAPGDYVLEVKIVHANGTSDNPRVPRSLGVVGIRAVIGGKKAFMYNSKCDYQRHVFGSPLLVRAHPPPPPPPPHASSSSSLLPAISSSLSTSRLCQRADQDFGFWVRMSNPKLCYSSSNPYCSGDPDWVSDACAYNTQYVYVPVLSSSSSSSSRARKANGDNKNNNNNNNICKFHYYTPPHGPARSCLRHGDSRAFLYVVGDSVMREYAKSCDLISLRAAKLQCLFANIALEGQHFSNSYAESVAKAIVQNVRENNVGVFATNLGLQHMIGPCTTKQWKIFIRYFVLYWKAQVVWAKSADPSSSRSSSSSSEKDKQATSNEDQQEEHPNDEQEEGKELDSLTISVSSNESSSSASGGVLDSSSSTTMIIENKLKRFYYSPRYLRTKGDYPKLEQAVWIGPPTIHYARKGMGAERASHWDEIAWRELEPLGFIRMKTIPVTQARQEGTWDGLHYASERNKIQTQRKNSNAKIYRWNGGVANVLFTILLNLICNRPV